MVKVYIAILAVSLVLGAGAQIVGYGDPELHEFLIGNEGKREVPINLGDISYACIGNIEYCNDGFTVAFWIKVDKGYPNIPAQYFLSSGGQSAMSEGFYVRRNYGKEIEVGVTRRERKWSGSFFLLENAEAHILLSWSEGDEVLEIYVDGIMIAKDSVSAQRVYTDPRFDPWRNIVVGKANDDRAPDALPELEIYNITHWAKYYEMTEVIEFYQQKKEHFYKGCVSGRPGGATENVDVDRNELVSNEVILCRKHCSTEKYPLSLLQNNKMCTCFDPRFDPSFMNDLDASVKCSSNSEWEVYWASSIDSDPDNSINFEVDIIYPTDKGYTRPGEEIVFEFTANTVEMVTFKCDYGDGETVDTLDVLTSHNWKTEGSFIVTLSAVTRLNQETKTFTINITDVDEGIGPELVRVKASPTKTSHQVEVYASVVSKAMVDCTLDFGDGNTQEMKGLAEFVNNMKIKHIYPIAGFYDLHFFCDNGYGTEESRSFTVAQNRKVDFVTKMTGDDIAIPLVGADNHVENLQVFVNAAKLVSSAVTIENDQIILHNSQFPVSGEYLIQVKSGWLVLHQRIANFQDGIKGVSIRVNKEYLDGTEPVEITFVINGGDHTHLHIKYGDGKEEFLYYPNGGNPLTVTKTHSYKELGWYTINIVAANDVGFVQTSKMVTSEREIKNISLSVANLTSLDAFAEFTLEVDQHQSPAMPFSVRFDYANGYEETVILGEKKDIATPVVHKYQYPDYGIYYFNLKVYNNISAVVVYGMIQVGQNITYVDMITTTEKVEESHMVVIEIDCPHGTPVTYDVDMGDGNTITVTIPDGGEEKGTSPPEAAEGSGEVDFMVTTEEPTGQERRKRSIEGMVNSTEVPDEVITSVTFVPRDETNEEENMEDLAEGSFNNLAGPNHKNDKMVIKYKYSKPGRYSPSVVVHNPFNEATTWLCPDIVVVPQERVDPVCDTFGIEITTPTTLENPLVLPRSDTLFVQSDSTIKCSIDPSVLMLDYTWKTARKPNPDVSDEEWRTELEVCASQLASPNFTIPGNSLWYGTYKLTVTLGMSVKDTVLGRRKRGVQNEVDLTGYTLSVKIAQTDMYLKVVPSELNATFGTGGIKIDIPKFNVLKLDISGSHDPDVPQGQANKTGMWAEVVCYRESRAPEFQDMDLEEVLSKAGNRLATNMFETVSFYDVGGCITLDEKIDVDVQDWQVLILAGNLAMEESVVFKASVHKDSRTSWATQDVRVWPSNSTGDLLDSLDDLLASGDASAALFVLDIVAGGLDGEDSNQNDTDAKAQRAEVRGKLIDALETVSSIVSNPDQLDKTVGVLGSVVAVADEVSDDKKGTAASALNNSASKAADLTGNVPLTKVSDMAGGMVEVAGNVLPFEEEEPVVPVPTTTTPPPKRTTTFGPSSPRKSAPGTTSAAESTDSMFTTTTMKTTTVAEMSVEEMATMAEKEVLLTVPGTTRLVNETFTDDLTDPNSESFQEIENYVCSQVSTIMENSTLRDNFQDCQVTEMRNGSVIVDYTMYLLKPNHLDIRELYDMVSDDLSRLDLPNSLRGVDNIEVIAYTSVAPTIPTMPFTTITPTMMAASLVFSPSTLPTSYVSVETMPITTTTTTPSSTPSISPTTIPVLATTTLPVPTEPPEPPCCERVNGLCEWVEPECEHLDESIRKNETWTEEMCDEIHPDDITEYQERFQMYKDMLKRQKFARSRKQTTNAMKALDSMGDVLLGKSDKDSNITLESPKLKMSVAKIPAGNGTMGGMNYPGSALEGQENVGAKTMESANPFTYSDSASQVKTNVKALSFTYPNGTAIKMENTSEPFNIWLDGKPDKVPNALNYTHFIDTKTLKMSYHTVVLPGNDSGLHLEIIPQNPEDKYRVFVSYLDFPNNTHYDYMTEMPHEDPTWDTDREEEIAQLPYLVFPPPEVSKYNGSYRIGIQLIETKLSLVEGENNGNYSYSFRAFLSGCRFWNEEEESWSTDGCTIGNSTTMYRTQCLCNHLTSFGGDFAVPPNTIDFSTVFSLENFLEAMPVFCTVGIILVLYVIVCIWARREDKKDLIRWGAAPLEDNLPSDKYHYQMTVYTGTKKQAGTTSKISFILSGDESDTGVRRLFDGKRKEHESGSICNYVLSVEQSLGPLTYLRIWHDNSGKGKKRSWQLGQVILTDLQTNEKFVFLCDRWLAVEEDDGQVDRIVPVAGMKDLTSFKHLFNGSIRKKMANDHIWVSVLSRPTRSNFTRVQRVSCCVALLFLTMITNCMFFRGDAEQSEEKVEAINLGPISFTMTQLVISIQTTLIVFPPSMFIVVVFRKSRTKKNTVQQTSQQASKKFKWRALQGSGSSLWYNTKRSRMDKLKDSVRNIVNFHKRSKYAEEETYRATSARSKMVPKKKKKGFSLPFWWVYIGWFVCILTILASAFFTVLYSMEWGREKSLDWLATFCLSFFQSVIVVQPIKVLLFAAFLSCVLRKPDLDDDEEAFDDGSTIPIDDELLNCDQDKLQELMERRKQAAADVQPPDMESLNAARELRMKEMAMEALLKEIITYAIFVLIVFFLSYQARDSDSFIYAENIKNTFFRNSPTFDGISKQPQYFQWIHSTLLPNLYSGKHYNGSDLNWREKLQIDDRVTIRLGVARIRQQRIKDDTCNVEAVFKKVIKHCRDDYSWTADDTKDYLTGWVKPTPGNMRRHSLKDCYMDDLLGNQTSLRDEESPWIYRNSVELKQAPYAGTLAMYKGGGYTFTFKRTREDTERLLKELEDHDWLDVNSRAVFLEFTVYNANVNLFGSVIMLIEFMSTGGAVTRAEVKVFRLSSYVGSFGYIVLFFEIVFCAFVLYFFYNCIKLLRKERLKYFKDFWNLIDFVTFVMAIVTIVMYAMKKVFGAVAMTVLEESMQPGNSGSYVNFVTISIWDETFGFILAMVVFFATLKFIKMLKFNKRMGMLGDTILLATADLKSFCLMFAIYYFAFAQCAFQLFGKVLMNFSSFVYTCEELFAVALGAFDFHALQEAQPLLGPVFFFVYIWVVSIGLLGMFLTIIDNAFAEVKANTENQANDYEIVEFMMKKLKGVFGWS